MNLGRNKPKSVRTPNARKRELSITPNTSAVRVYRPYVPSKHEPLSFGFFQCSTNMNDRPTLSHPADLLSISFDLFDAFKESIPRDPVVPPQKVLGHSWHPPQSHLLRGYDWILRGMCVPKPSPSPIAPARPVSTLDPRAIHWAHDGSHFCEKRRAKRHTRRVAFGAAHQGGHGLGPSGRFGPGRRGGSIAKQDPKHIMKQTLHIYLKDQSYYIVISVPNAPSGMIWRDTSRPLGVSGGMTSSVQVHHPLIGVPKQLNPRGS